MRKTSVFAAMRAALLAACAMLACAFMVHADDLEAPQPKVKANVDAGDNGEQRKQANPFRRKLFWAETGVLAASAAWDWTTTAQCQQRGCAESASRWAIGPFPSNARIAGYGAAWFAGDATGLYFAEKSRHRWVRWLGRAYVAYETQDHLRLAFRNRGLCRPLGSCSGKL